MQTVPVRPLPLALSPFEVGQRLHHLPGFLFFDSADAETSEESKVRSRLSILAAEPDAVHRGHLHHGPDRRHLQSLLAAHRTPEVDWGFPLGGLFGHVSYEGDYCFGEHPSLLVHDHHRDQWFAVGESAVIDRWLSMIETDDAHPRDAESGPSIPFQPLTSREVFLQNVARAQDWIAAGDIYQVNLTQQFRAPRRAYPSAFSLYERLRSLSPAPYGAYLDDGERQVLSSSPECFLKMSGRGITTRPIKGTRPRFADPQLDEKSAYDLLTSSKEISELVMITDLERNDLGRLCRFGAVHVTELLALERYAQVFHLVSTVTGELRDGVDHVEALQQCSPGGSITGAPKKRAREIIAELEQAPRGLYTGSIGYLGWNGESQFNIAIRTLIGEPDHWHFHVGAGIVADSEPEAEYEETLHKAAGIFAAAETPRPLPLRAAEAGAANELESGRLPSMPSHR